MSRGDLAAMRSDRARFKSASRTDASLLSQTFATGRSLATYELPAAAAEQHVRRRAGQARYRCIFPTFHPYWCRPFCPPRISASSNIRASTRFGSRKAVYVDLKRAAERAGRFHHLHAAGAQSLPPSRQELEAKNGRGADHAAPGAQALEVSDLRAIRNLVYLGGDGAFGINGVGEAAQAYFNKDVRKLNLPEAATDRRADPTPDLSQSLPLSRCALSIAAMWCSSACTKTITSTRNNTQRPLPRHWVCKPAKASCLNRNILSMPPAERWRGNRTTKLGTPTAVYTTLDLRLQQAAERAIADGMQLVDKQLASRRGSAARTPTASGHHRSRSSHRRSKGALWRPRLRRAANWTVCSPSVRPDRCSSRSSTPRH